MKNVRLIVLTFLIAIHFYICPGNAFSEGGYHFVTKWGSLGSGNGQFIGAFGVSVDSSGNVYVTDVSNVRIQKFSSTGSYITNWGSFGLGIGQFMDVEGIAVDSSGNVYVGDANIYRIQKFSSTGNYITQWGSSGSGNGQFKPNGIAVDSSGNVYVTETLNDRIQKFSSTGSYITQWGSTGSGNDQFNCPWGVAVDSSGNVYVVDSSNNRIKKFSSGGNYITQWGVNGSAGTCLLFPASDGCFWGPTGIAIDSSGNVYVADTWNHRIQKFSSTGNYITKWGSQGSGDGQFISPYGIAVDSSGNVYVADTNNSRIQKFSPDTATAPYLNYVDTVQKIFVGYYQRPAAPPGLIYWATRLNQSGGNLSEIIEAFANSAESQALYGTINSGNIATVVDNIFMAFFNRHVGTPGLTFYVNGFNAGQFTPATIMLNVLNGAQNEDLQSVNNKVTAANLFTRTIDPDLDGNNFQAIYSGSGDVTAARDFLKSVTSVNVPTQAETTAYIKANIADPGDSILTQ